MDGSGIVVADTEDMAMLRDSARGLFSRAWPPERAVTRSRDDGALRTIWADICAAGWAELDLDVDEQGLLLGLCLAEECGRASCPAPLAGAMLAQFAFAAQADNTSGLRAFLDGIAAGEVIPAWVFGPDSGEAGGASFRASGTGDAMTLTGKAAYVENAGIATHVIVLTGQGAQAAIVPVQGGGVTFTATPGLSTAPLWDVTFAGASPVIVATLCCTPDHLIRLARLFLTTRALGAATRGLELLTDYVQEREQFGKKIGQFQAIQHKLVNCLIGVETCKLAMLRAGCGSGTPDEQGYAMSAATALAAQTLRNVLMELHHGFGGISFWNEHELPRHFRMIHSDLTRLGGVYAARREIAEFLFGPLTQERTTA